MKTNVNKVYILTPQELTVIAAARNIQGMLGMQNSEHVVDQSAVCYALNHLYQKEFIYNTDGEGFVLEDGLRELIKSIEEAKSVVMLRQFFDDSGVKVVYIGDRLVVTEQKNQDPSTVRLYEIPVEELEAFLLEEELGEQETNRIILDEEQLLQEGMKEKKILSDETIEDMGNILTVVEKMTPKKNKVRCRMIAKKDKKWIRYTQEKQELEHLQEEEFYQYMLDMVKEDLDDIS
ncbi:MAG: hypothetical protein E7264_06695 [Lachnospiraceae bacterium]|nr:hypothetical protein [Lachnospiraceae bacterium]